MKEEDLFPFIKEFYEAQGCRVWSEVSHSDVVVQQDEYLFAIEMKTAFSIKLLDQLVSRMAGFDGVYAAIPVRSGQQLPPNFAAIRRILSALGIGLILVKPNAKLEKVAVVFQPNRKELLQRASKRRREKVLREINARYVDAARAGISGKNSGLTAYRQKSLLILDALVLLNAPARPAQIAKLSGIGRAQIILSADLHGWFLRVDRGLYSPSQAGQKVWASSSEIIEKIKQTQSKFL